MKIFKSKAKRLKTQGGMKPCPWCESDSMEFVDRSGFYGVSVECANCGMVGPSGWDEDRALNLWNAIRIDKPILWR